MPTLSEVEGVLRTVKAGKAPGLDSIPGEMLRSVAKATARHLFPIMLKASLTMRQPLQWRGGVLHAAYKGSGATDVATNFRSLFVSSTAGKAFHRLMRGKITPAAEGRLGACHFGIRAGCPVSHGSHLVIAHEQYCRKSHKSSAVLFLDTRAAYYRVVREAAVGLSDPADLDKCVFRVLRHFEMPESAWQDILTMVCSGGAMHEAGVSPHLRAIARDSHEDSFFVTQYFSKARVCRTRAGSRPGESLADLIFSFIYDRVLYRIREAMRQERLTDPIPYDGERSVWHHDPQDVVFLTDATWADDSAFMTHAQSPELLLQRVQRMTALVYDHAKALALDPNLKAGKTELLISLRGGGSREAAKQWFGKRGANLDVQTKSSGIIRIRVVADYIHLGFHIDRGVTYKPEALRRLAQAGSACREYNAMLLHNPRVQRGIRTDLFATLVESTFFNLELWTGEEHKAWKKLVDGHSRLQRGLLRCELHPEKVMRLSPADVSLILGVPSLQILLRSKRLRYLVTLVRAAPDELWAVLKAEKTWICRLLEDLQWFVTVASGSWPAVDEQHWPLWWHELRDRPGRFKRQVGQAVKQATLRGLRPDLENEAVASMRQSSTVYHRMSQAQMAATEGVSCYCGPCGKHFQARTHFACHLRHIHGRRADHLYYNGDCVCPGCRRDFRSWTRILKHLKVSSKCLDVARLAGQMGEIPSSGEGSRSWKDDVAKNPAIAPACARHKTILLYDDEEIGAVLPREKLQEGCAAAVGSAIDDWAQGEFNGTNAAAQCQEQLWRIVRGRLVTFPLFIEEHRRALSLVVKDISELCGKAFQWSSDCQELIFRSLNDWQETLSYQSLAGDTPCQYGMDGSVRPPSFQDVGISHHEPFLFTREHVVAFLGDELPTAERTHLLTCLADRLLYPEFCKWSWPSFRKLEESRLDAICLCISSTWEVKDVGNVDFGWRPFTLEVWSENPLLRQATVVRFLCCFAKQAWKLFLHGRQIAMAFCGKARCLLHSPPVRMLCSHGDWVTWSRGDWVVTSASCRPQADGIATSWGFTIAPDN